MSSLQYEDPTSKILNKTLNPLRHKDVCPIPFSAVIFQSSSVRILNPINDLNSFLQRFYSFNELNIKTFASASKTTNISIGLTKNKLAGFLMSRQSVQSSQITDQIYKTEDLFLPDESRYYIKNANSGISTDFDEEIGIKNEVGLFRAVIMQALIDAVSNSKRTEDKIARMCARGWFSEHNKDFKMVCELANLNFRWVIKKAKDAIQNDCRWRKELTKNSHDKAA